MVMRQLAAVGETYAQTAIEDASWSLFPPNSSQAGTSRSTAPPAGSTRVASGLHVRSTSHTANDSLANLMAMAETVHEVLPHIPDDLIFQVKFSSMLGNVFLLRNINSISNVF